MAIDKLQKRRLMTKNWKCQVTETPSNDRKLDMSSN